MAPTQPEEEEKDATELLMEEDPGLLFRPISKLDSSSNKPFHESEILDILT